ncbi:MAG TPA: hypothetical protein VN445_09170 [Rectinemataceae bacterium]|nr:hypothetical protein [Rectinemataceae bacterium]
MKTSKWHRPRFLRAALAFALALLTLAGLGAQDAVSSPSAQARNSFLDFPGKLDYHMVAGWTSTGLLFAAGALGAARALDLMNRGHEIRQNLGIDDEDDPAIRSALGGLWGDGQALRWLHVGFLVTGEALYLGNAVTGLSMKLPKGERTLAADIHLVSFITHAALMASEILIGVMTTDALKRGDHEAHLGLVTAHAAIGIAIPLVMAGAGLATTTDLSFLSGR